MYVLVILNFKNTALLYKIWLPKSIDHFKIPALYVAIALSLANA